MSTPYHRFRVRYFEANAIIKFAEKHQYPSLGYHAIDEARSLPHYIIGMDEEDMIMLKLKSPTHYDMMTEKEITEEEEFDAIF